MIFESAFIYYKCRDKLTNGERTVAVCFPFLIHSNLKQSPMLNDAEK